MRNSKVVLVFTALLSLAMGMALYYVFLHATRNLTASGEPPALSRPGPTSSAAASATGKDFRFKTYNEPRALPELQF